MPAKSATVKYAAERPKRSTRCPRKNAPRVVPPRSNRTITGKWCGQVSVADQRSEEGPTGLSVPDNDHVIALFASHCHTSYIALATAWAVMA
jgi:hypothetical protein